MRIINKCKYCGKKFEDVPSNKRVYCSRQCKIDAQRNGKYKVCVICGKKFYVFKKYAEKHQALFCSQKCKSSQKIEKVCPKCGKVFKVKPSQSSQKFCCIKCFVEKNNPKRIRHCKICGKEFKVAYPSMSNTHCSVKCAGISRRKEEIHIISKCVTCKKEFEHTIYDVGRYCSKKCYLNNSGVSAVELMLKKDLLKLGFVHQLKYKLGHMDYGHKEKKIVVFVDGKFWHGRNDVQWENTPMANSISRAIIRDKEQTKYLECNGWIVLRYWDDYVRSKTDECLNEITDIANNR